MDAIVPAAGLATRMRGLPKFLLPCDLTYTTLIEQHVSSLLETCNTIWIPTRPELVMIIDSLGLPRDRVVLLPMQTENMTQTVKRVLQITSNSYFHLVMPDTYFFGDQPYAKLAQKPDVADLACWRIRDDQKGKLGQVLSENGRAIDVMDKKIECEYEYSWGSLTFNRELLDNADDSDPHIGYAVKRAIDADMYVNTTEMEGKYFDFGTPSEYLNMLQEVIAPL
jgi:choline kinase